MALFSIINMPVVASANETQLYTYDALGRLVAVQRTGGINSGQVHSICYDAAGNRVSYAAATTGVPVTCVPTSAPTPAPTPVPAPTPTPTPTPTPASFSISDAQGTEGSTVIFNVVRTGNSAGTNSINFATADGTATSTGDYFAAAGTLTFGPNETTKTVVVTTRDNASFESDETFVVNLTAPTGGATIADAQGVGTIYDNE